jgi:succinate dehydrogenase / fumarate reductase iron-sulfur subunit
MKLVLRIWRQASAEAPGYFEDYPVESISPDFSFLEVLDRINEDLAQQQREPIAFEMDCREGICGSCSLMINGTPHGPQLATTTCQLYMRHFKDGEVITVEPWRSNATPIIKDLIVDRSSMDRIMQSAGYISVHTGEAPDANTILIDKANADSAFQAASCIGCGACIAACPNASAMLFVAAKVTQLAILPQGKPERFHRVLTMVEAMDREGFGNCSNHYECAKACPKSIPISLIARLNKEFMLAGMFGRKYARPGPHGEHEE